MRGIQPFRHGGGKPEGKEGVQHSHVRGRNPIKLYSSRALIGSLLYPGQMGTGQKCSNVGIICPHLNICAPKPHQRWVPRLYPVPIGFNAFLFGEGGGTILPVRGHEPVKLYFLIFSLGGALPSPGVHATTKPPRGRGLRGPKGVFGLIGLKRNRSYASSAAAGISSVTSSSSTSMPL